MKTFNMIVAMDSRSGIGKAGKLPWHLSGDLQHFKRITTQVRQPGKQNMVIMGRKTFESLPDNYSPLPERINVVLSRNVDLSLPSGVFRATSLEDALHLAENDLGDQVEGVFVIGGGEIFQQCLNHPQCRKMYLTFIEHDFDCDTFFPPDLRHFERVSKSERAEENGIAYYFAEYQAAQIR